MRFSLRQTAFWVVLALACSPSAARTEVTSATLDDEVVTKSILGNYLAGRFAKTAQDNDNAASFYGRALARDPQNDILLEQAFQTETTAGNWDHTLQLARKLVETQPTHRMAHFVLGVEDFKNKEYAKADEHFKSASENPIGELTSALARAWTKLASGNADAAFAILDLPKQPDWAQLFLRYHRGLIADIAGKKQVARTAYEKMFKQDSRTLRTSLAYAQHAASYGEIKLAKQIIAEQLQKSQNEQHPLALDLARRLNANDKVGLLISSPIDGMAEVFYGLGEALTGEGGVSLGVIYLQMALVCKPDHTFALAALASAQENAHRYDDAIATYDKIPKGTALQGAIDIRRAFNLNSLEKFDEAKAILERLSQRDPKDIRPVEALGNIMRTRKQYSDAVRYFSRVIELSGKPEARDWGYYYARGTSYERLKNWPAAEADLKRALALAPDQPLILNYLGYSWVDQGKNMKEGTKLIERAVQLKPDDGYIVDSLGWAHYKQENYKEAVKFLERAVEIKPEDPTLNDHLGDAYWQIGREREARFQWDQALSLNPEPEDVDKIKGKLERGLPPRTEASQQQKSKQAEKYEPSRRRSENISRQRKTVQ